jgi:hypothetical protein
MWWASRRYQERRYGMQLIIVCRFIPGARTAVTLCCGLTEWLGLIVALSITLVISGIRRFRPSARLQRSDCARMHDRHFGRPSISYAVTLSSTEGDGGRRHN